MDAAKVKMTFDPIGRECTVRVGARGFTAWLSHCNRYNTNTPRDEKVVTAMVTRMMNSVA